MDPDRKNTLSGPDIRLHYLGHAAFLLLFGTGSSVLMDYGQSCAYGLDSPVYDIGSFQPTVVTYSHRHPDHDRGATFDTEHILDGLDELTLEDITIEPVRTTERTPEDNTSYRIAYKGFSILHLGDAQGSMARIDHQDMREHLKANFSEPIDLLLLPIGWTRDIIREGEVTVALLQPRRVIPMHYWNAQEKRRFLRHLAAQNRTAWTTYQVKETVSAEYDVWVDEADGTPIRVISLEPAPFNVPPEGLESSALPGGVGWLHLKPSGAEG